MAELQTPQTLVEWLDDLCVRFLLNLPASELSSVPRLCFQVEEAQWFYEDFVRPAVQASGAPPLPSLPLRQFCLRLFQHCPLLSGFTDAQHLAAYEEFLAYKVRVPVRGAILLDHNMEKLVLVRGWKKGASWSFPRGKINKDEKDLDCAIREVYEETGFDLSTSGLIPENENDVKYIDITMREQHMRLFVFRGVPDDTYFETKTRKEISKIQWYWIKDLPGFKRHSKNQQQSEAETVHANKFYMVAPFLGPLKKWIGQQRKQDLVEAQRQMAARSGLAAVDLQTGTEDESEDHQGPEWNEVSVGQREQELKRLLSIGSAYPSAPRAPAPDAHAGNLLAMLQGGSQTANLDLVGVPHTPFEQINMFPSQPETPQPHHLRQPVLQQNQGAPPPQFPFSPQRLQQEPQRNVPLPTPNVFGHGPGQPGMVPNQPPGFPPTGLPPNLQQQQFLQRAQNPGAMQFGQPSGIPFNGPPRPPMQPPPGPMPQFFQQPPPPNAFMAQGPQGAIASGPAVPNASQLPPPRLNQHTMRLLDAFKTGKNQPAPPTKTSGGLGSSSRPSSTHQTALLDLFKKPVTSTPPLAQATSSPIVDEPVSPTPTDATEKPSRPAKLKERKPTLNEITRTLPLKSRQKSTTELERPTEFHSQPVEKRELFDPGNSENIAASASRVRATTTDSNGPPSPVRILQRPSSEQDSSSPTAAYRKATSSNSPTTKATTGTENGGHSSSFTLLTRPGSSREVKTPVTVPPTSPLRNETPKTSFQPQVLKRPQTEDAEREKPVDKKEQLLALFGKPSKGNTPPISTAQPQQEIQRKSTQPPNDPKANLLDLFNAPPPSQRPAPPSAPKIHPSSSAATGSTSSGNKQQSLLLDLFNKASNTSTASPGTPISPFTLGTPATTRAPAETAITNNTSASPSSGGPSSATTPVEAKEFLMGYLNGVVRNEGYRGAGAKG